MTEIILTHEEQKAIKSLERLAKKWPQSLLLFAGGTGLTVRKPINGIYDRSTVVANILGMPNDGGDGGDEF